MKTFLVQLNHVVGSRSFCQTILVEAEKQRDVLPRVAAHLEESSSDAHMDEDGRMWLEPDYYVEILDYNEVSTFDELKNSIFTLR